MGVPRFTTPTITLEFDDPDVNFTQATAIYVTFKQANRDTLTISGANVTATTNTVSVSLSQEQSGQFVEGDVEIQVNWKNGNKRSASEAVKYPFTKQLLQKVV